MALDRFTLLFLVTRDGAPPQSEEERAATQDAHLAHLAELHEEGVLVAAGPTPDPEWGLRGTAVFACDEERARELMAHDPAVEAGWFSLKTVPWLAPRGAVRSQPVPFPRSAAEAAAE